MAKRTTRRHTPFIRRILEEVDTDSPPEGWTITRIDDVASRGTGHTPDKQTAHYWDGDIKWISLTDCPRLDSVYIDETTSKITSEGIANSSAVLHPAGTVLLSRDAGVGMSAIMKDAMAVSQHFITYRCNGLLDNVYLYYWLQFMKREFERQAVGSTIKTIGFSYFKRLEMLLPPLDEQVCIARSLLGCDKAVLKLEELIAAKRELKKGLMQQLLTGQHRFPEFVSTTDLKHHRYFDYPAEWELAHVGSVATEISKRNGNDDLPVLSCTKHDGLVNSLDYFGRRVFSEDLSNYKVVSRGQFAYATNHIEEGSIGLLDHVDAGVVSPMYTVFKTNSRRVHAQFLYLLFKTELYRHIFEVNTNASVDRRGSLRWSGFANIKVPLPGLPEQVKIAECIHAQQHEIELLEQELEAVRTQKKGLMQQLLTGKKRVPVESGKETNHA